jgi:hypothetical protein
MSDPSKPAPGGPSQPGPIRFWQPEIEASDRGQEGCAVPRDFGSAGTGGHERDANAHSQKERPLRGTRKAAEGCWGQPGEVLYCTALRDSRVTIISATARHLHVLRAGLSTTSRASRRRCRPTKDNCSARARRLLNAREGRFLLKYFGVGASRRYPLKSPGRNEKPRRTGQAGRSQHFWGRLHG